MLSEKERGWQGEKRVSLEDAVRQVSACGAVCNESRKSSRRRGSIDLQMMIASEDVMVDASLLVCLTVRPDAPKARNAPRSLHRSFRDGICSGLGFRSSTSFRATQSPCHGPDRISRFWENNLAQPYPAEPRSRDALCRHRKRVWAGRRPDHANN